MTIILEQLRTTAASFRNDGDHGTAHLMEEAARVISETVTRAELPSYSVELLAANYPTRTDASILSGPYTPTYIAAKRIEAAVAERDQLASMDDAAMDKMQAMIQEQSERIVAVASYAELIRGPAERLVRTMTDWMSDDPKTRFEVVDDAYRALRDALTKNPQEGAGSTPARSQRPGGTGAGFESPDVAQGAEGAAGTAVKAAAESVVGATHLEFETCTKPNETREGRWDYDDQDRTFYHTDFSTDAMLKLDGDWASVDQRITFAARVLKALAGEFCHQSCTKSELHTAATALYKWLVAVPFQEPPMKRFSIPDEVWEPFQDALFDSQSVACTKQEGGDA